MTKKWRKRGRRDFLAGRSIDHFYTYEDRLMNGSETNRAAYEAGWRLAWREDRNAKREARP